MFQSHRIFTRIHPDSLYPTYLCAFPLTVLFQPTGTLFLFSLLQKRSPLLSILGVHAGRFTVTNFSPTRVNPFRRAARQSRKLDRAPLSSWRSGCVSLVRRGLPRGVQPGIITVRTASSGTTEGMACRGDGLIQRSLTRSEWRQVSKTRVDRWMGGWMEPQTEAERGECGGRIQGGRRVGPCPLSVRT